MPPQKTPTGSSESGKKTILLIDDDKDILMLLKHQLEQSYIVDVVEDGVRLYYALERINMIS